MGVKVKWIISKKDEEIIYTFSKEELVVERMLALVMLGHEDIAVVWPDIEMFLLN